MVEESTTGYSEDEFLDKYEQKTKEHNYIMYPAIKKIIGKIEGKKILDIGSGSGYFSHQLATLGATVTGIDSSEEWVGRANKKYQHKNLKFQHMDGSDMRSLPSGNFDVAIINMVLLNVAKGETVQKIFKEVARVLNAKGILIFSDLHPLTLAVGKHGYRTMVPSKGFSYFHSGDEFTAKLDFGSYKIEFVNKHWTLEDYTRWLNNAGLVIYTILEPDYVAETPKEIARHPGLPEYIYLGCKKCSTA